MTSNTSAVRLHGVSKSFGSVEAVRELDLDVPSGCIYGLLGPNGSGKTTTIRMILGILGPDRGEVLLLGGPPHLSRGARVGYLPEERGLYRRMRVLDHLVFLGRIRGLEPAEARLRALRWLEELELDAWAGRRVEDLSKGMQQKVQFIGAVLHDPALLVLDEPFSGLDPISQDLLESILRRFRDAGATILLSTHLMDQAERMCQRVCLMAEARKVLDGELSELRSREATGVVALEFTGSTGWLQGPEVAAVELVPPELPVPPGDGDMGVSRRRTARVQLRSGKDTSPLLTRALAAGVQIQELRVLEPRLHEIFLRHVRSGRGG